MIKIKKHHEGAFLILLALGLSRAFNIISLPYLSRQLSASDFADYTLFVTAVSLLTALILFGFDASLIRVLSVDIDHSNTVKKKIYTLNGLIAFSATFVSMILIIVFNNDKYPVSTIFLFGSALFLSSIFPLAQAGLRAENSYQKLFLSLFLGGILTPIISVWLVSAGYTREALIYGYVFGIFVSTLIATSFDNYKLFNIQELSDSKFTESLRIGLLTTITAPLFWVITSLDKWVLNFYTNKLELGVYALSATLAAPYMMLVSALMTSFQPHALSLLSSTDEKSYAELKNDLVVLIYLLVLLWIVHSLAVLFFVRKFMPLQYEDIIYVSPILSAAYLYNGLFQAEKIKYLFIKKIKYSVYAMIISAAAFCLILLILAPKYGYFGAAFSQLICFLMMFIIGKWFGRNDLKHVNIDGQSKYILITVLIFSVAYLLLVSGETIIAIAFILPIILAFLYFSGRLIRSLKRHS